MRWLVLAIVCVAGCGAQGVEGGSACRYSFTAPAISSGTSQRCTVDASAALSLHFEDLLAVNVADGAPSGQARLEGVDTKRAALAYPGERFGLTSVSYDGHDCTAWAGHVFWNVEPTVWHVEAVGTSACGFTFAASFDSP